MFCTNQDWLIQVVCDNMDSLALMAIVDEYINIDKKCIFCTFGLSWTGEIQIGLEIIFSVTMSAPPVKSVARILSYPFLRAPVIFLPTLNLKGHCIFLHIS